MMMKRLNYHVFLLGALMVLWLPNKAHATHIVGGELEITHVSGDIYDIGMLLYFDDFYGNPLALDNTATVSVFSKANNQRIRDFVLTIRSNNFVEFSNPECAASVPNLRTRRIFYSVRVVLDPNNFADPDGYYFTYERCCRNDLIENLNDPGGTGQTFYLEFPPLLVNGQRFINSSPRLFPPLSDFAAVGKQFFTDFRGSDLDGDSLSYSLITPLRGTTTATNTGGQPGFSPSPAPYPNVTFANGYNVNNMVRGTPALAIDTAGFLTVTPSETGLYVFAILCEEYRNGVKIGEVRRDFQMLVVIRNDIDPPVIDLELEPGVSYQQPDPANGIAGDTIKVLTGVGRDSCFTVKVADPNGEDDFTLRVNPKNGASREVYVNGLANLEVAFNETGEVELCLNDCPRNLEGVYEVDVLIGDNSCAKPLFDTLNLIFEFQLQPNEIPFSTANIDTTDSDTVDCDYAVSLDLEDLFEFDLTANDLDGDRMTLEYEGLGFNPAALGMSFREISSDPLVKRFSWRPDCNALDSGEFTENFIVKFTTSDFGFCGLKDTSSQCISIDIFFNPGPNLEPSISETTGNLNFDAANNIYRDTILVGENYNLNFLAEDPNGDYLFIVAIPEGFGFRSSGIDFTNFEGWSPITQSFSWTPDCDNVPGIAVGDFFQTYDMTFYAKDSSECWIRTFDTIQVQLVVEFRPDPNQSPLPSIEGLTPSSDEPIIYDVQVRVGERLDLVAKAVDPDGGPVYFELQPQGFALTDIGATFSPSTTISGIDSVSGNLQLEVTCEMLAEGFEQKVYEMLFIAVDTNECNLITQDSMTLRLTFDDIVQIDLTSFANAFSPNGDNVGDEFRIDNLPLDNCREQFELIRIFNRWGSEVYQSKSRDFRWDGSDLPSGAYFYIVYFGDREYKGSLHMFRE